MRVAEKHGLKPKTLFCNIDYLRNNAVYPCIIHWNFQHFVVLTGFKGKDAVINDPARGVEVVPENDFLKSFTGISVFFEPTDSFEAGGKPSSIKSFVMERLKSSASAIILIMIAALLSALPLLVAPLLSRVFADRVLAAGGGDMLPALLLIMIAFAVYSAVIIGLKEIYLYKVMGRLAISSNIKFMWHTLRLPMSFYSQRMAGEVAGRQRNNDMVAQTMAQVLAPLLLNVILLIFYLAIMLRSSVPLSLIGVAGIIINIAVAQYTTKKRIVTTRIQMRDDGKLRGTTAAGI
jgi:ABC-type bacteriocin/lantibiotic exporter with double-glycine peptidase domain